MRSLYFGGATACVLALGMACTSIGTPPPTTPVTPSLQDEYEPLAAVPATGGITQITFYGDGTYSLRRALDSSLDEVLTREDGTFSLDLTASTLTLTPNGGSPQTLPFQLGLTGTPAGTSQTQSLGLRPQGIGTTIIHLIISFILDGETFHTDSPAIPDTGSVDPNAWPAPLPTSADGGTACSNPTDAAVSDAAPDAAAPPSASGDGIDVSHYQGSVDWSSVHGARNFGYAKATEGAKYTDGQFAANWQGMQAAGIPRGAYHFFRAAQDPVVQADHFVAALQTNGFDPASDLAPMLDVEVMDGADAATVTSGIRSFLDEAQTQLGVTLILYTGPSFWAHQLGNPNFSSNPLWIAHYTKAPQPTVPSSWPGYTIWQFTDHDAVTGVSGGVDGDQENASASPAPSDGGTSAPPPTCSGGSDAGLIPGTCTHDECTAGDPLGQACTACTMVLCANDPYCCDTYWGVSCLPEVQTYCGITCP